jgi:hypothetical protein
MLLKCLRASVRADQSSENHEHQVQSIDENTSLNAVLGKKPNRAGLPTLTKKKKKRKKSKTREGVDVTFVLPAVSAIQILGNIDWIGSNLFFFVKAISLLRRKNK